jgi:hypothetical protein
MKVIISFIVAVLFVASPFAATWTAPTAYPVKIQIDTSFAPNSSITGVDSVSILTNIKIDPTCTYALAFRDSMGAADSFSISIRIKNSAGTVISVVSTDNHPASTTYRITDLPINKTVFGYTFSIKAIGLVAALKRTFKQVDLIRVTPITPYEPSKTR